MCIYDLFIIFNSLWIYAKINVIGQVGWQIQELRQVCVCYLLALALRISLVRGGGTSLDLILSTNTARHIWHLCMEMHIFFFCFGSGAHLLLSICLHVFRVEIVLSGILFSGTNSLIFMFSYISFHRVSALDSVVRFWHFIFWDILAFENRKFLQIIYKHEWSH